MNWLKKLEGLLGIKIEICVSIIATVVLIWQLTILNNQLAVQSKTMKADNLIKLNQQIYPCENMKEIIEAIGNDKPILKKNRGPFTEVVLDNFLGYFEMLGIMERRGYLDADLIYDMFGSDIEAISNNKEIQKYIQSEKEKGYNWPFLNCIIQKIKTLDCREKQPERKINRNGS
ncbi:MAG: hypothetical protein NTX89_02040 [Candidatus Omnitrophica bacterium]|nr:hypothetical protein [Candidatus Omnitrophota bacterium]